MNLAILNTEIQKFIEDNLKTDIAKLIFKGSPFSTATIQEIATQIESKNKCQQKLPTWYKTPNLYYPPKINIEQTSSEIAAKHKANLVNGNNLIDITGGFGVDCFCFSKKIDRVIHCEVNNELAQIAEHNFNHLGATNISQINDDGLSFLKQNNQRFDWIYADPSRRNDVKGKVFLLKDCLPNIPENLDLLFKYTSNVLLKIAPILDISSALNELNFTKEVQIIAVDNEVKELLFLLEKNTGKPIKIKTFNYTKTVIQQFHFSLNENCEATYSEPKKYLYEPNSAILKSGAFQQISEHYKINKLHLHSHLYTSDELIDFPGRVFNILQISNYSKKEIKNYVPTKKANITTRNFPESVAQIRKKLQLNEGGNVYLFFTTNIHNKTIVLICEKM